MNRIMFYKLCRAGPTEKVDFSLRNALVKHSESVRHSHISCDQGCDTA